MKILNNFFIQRQFVQNQNISKSKQIDANAGYVQFGKSSSIAIRNNALSCIDVASNQNKIDLITTKLKQMYGIEAKFTNLDTARLFLLSVEDFVKLNNKAMFEGLKVDILESDDWLVETDTQNKTCTIFLNNSSLAEIEKKAQEEYDLCEIPSASPKTNFYKTLGMFLCFKYNPYAFEYNSKAKDIDEDFATIARKIGSTSLIDVNNFNANYIVARMSSMQLPSNAQMCYEYFSGAKLNFPKLPLEEQPSIECNRFSSIDEAKEHLKQYGIEADFHNLIVANFMIGAIEDFIRLNNNPKMFEGLIIQSEVGDSPDVFAITDWDFKCDKLKNPKIVFNLMYDFERLDAITKDNYDAGHFGNNDPKGQFYHELAHWLDLKNNPKEFNNQHKKYSKKGYCLSEYSKKIFGKVSGYATTDPLEFKAEYVACRMCGVKFPKAVNKMYEKLEPLSLKFPS